MDNANANKAMEIDASFFTAYHSQKIKYWNNNERKTTEKPKRNRIKSLIPLLTFLWLILSSFTLVGLILAFYGKTVMFKYSFVSFSWFMTFCNQPFVFYPILKAMSLYHRKMDDLNQCQYIFHRSMYAFFIFINMCNTYLLIAFPSWFSACLLIGFYNVILAFKFGAYLSLNTRGTFRFHTAHFCMYVLYMFRSVPYTDLYLVYVMLQSQCNLHSLSLCSDGCSVPSRR